MKGDAGFSSIPFFVPVILNLFWLSDDEIFGGTLKNLLGDIKKYNMYIAIGVMTAGFLIWLIRDVKKRR